MRAALIALCILWSICLVYQFLKKPVDLNNEALIPSAQEFIYFGDSYRNPGVFEYNLKHKKAGLNFLVDPQNADKNLRKEFITENFRGDKILSPNYLNIIKELYYFPGLRLENAGHYELAKKKFISGFNHCFELSREFLLGERDFQSLFFNLRLKHSFYTTYGIPKPNSITNSFFYDSQITSGKMSPKDCYDYVNEAITNIGTQYRARKLFGLSHSIHQFNSGRRGRDSIAFDYDYFVRSQQPRILKDYEEEAEEEFESVDQIDNYEKQRAEDEQYKALLNELKVTLLKDLLELKSDDLKVESCLNLAIYSNNVNDKRYFYNKIISEYPVSYLADDAQIGKYILLEDYNKRDSLMDYIKTNYKNSDIAPLYYD